RPARTAVPARARRRAEGGHLAVQARLASHACLFRQAGRLGGRPAVTAVLDRRDAVAAAVLGIVAESAVLSPPADAMGVSAVRVSLVLIGTVGASAMGVGAVGVHAVRVGAVVNGRIALAAGHVALAGPPGRAPPVLRPLAARPLPGGPVLRGGQVV